MEELQLINGELLQKKIEIDSLNTSAADKIRQIEENTESMSD